MAFNPDAYKAEGGPATQTPAGSFNPDNYSASGFNPSKYSTAESDMPPFVDPTKPAPNAPEAPTLTQRFMRQTGLGIRNVVEGAAGFPLLVGDAANTLLNYIPGVNLQLPSQLADQALTDAGLPTAQTSGERLAASVQQATAGAIAGMGAAKGVVTPFTEALTANPGQQVVAAAAAGAGFHSAQEADLGPMGQIAVGLASALVGAHVAGKVGNAFGRSMERRIVLRDKAISRAEVQAELANNGVQVDGNSEQLRALTEQLNELRTQSKIEAQIRQLEPAPTDTLEQARYKRAQQAKLGTPAPTLEIQRARTMLREKEIAKVEAKIRAQEDATAQNQPTIRAAKQVAATSAAQTQQALTAAETVRGTNVPRNSAGLLTLKDRFGAALIDRVQKLSPEIAIAVRRVSQRAATRANHDIERVMKFYDSRELKALPKADRAELDRHLLNSNYEEAQTIMGQVPGLRELYNENVRALMIDMSQKRIAGGADGFIEDFHPRVVKNVAALRKVANRTQRSGRGTGQRGQAGTEGTWPRLERA